MQVQSFILHLVFVEFNDGHSSVTARDICSVQLVCTLWRDIFQDPSNDSVLWRTVCLGVFGLHPSVSHTLPSWQSFCHKRGRNESYMFHPYQQTTFLAFSTRVRQLQRIFSGGTDPAYEAIMGDLQKGLQRGLFPCAPFPQYAAFSNTPAQHFISLTYQLLDNYRGLPHENLLNLLYWWGANRRLLGTFCFELRPEELVRKILGSMEFGC